MDVADFEKKVMEKEILSFFKDYPVKKDGQYFGKLSIKVLKLDDTMKSILGLGKGDLWYSPDRTIPKKRIIAIHIRPYRISSRDKIVQQNDPNSPFKNLDSEFDGDYDLGSGNFHKLIGNEKDVRYQIVLMADIYENGEKVGAEARGPGIPEDVKEDGKLKKAFLNEDGTLTKGFLEKIDEMEMYFPKVSEKNTAKMPLDELLAQALEALRRGL